MPFALPSDIAVGTREQAVQTLENAIVKQRFPNAARDASLDVPKGWFDLEVDAASVLAARAEILSPPNGDIPPRWALTLDAMIWFDAETYSGVRLRDSEKTIDVICIVLRWRVDTEEERTEFELMG